MAEAARKYMAGQSDAVKAMSGTALGQRLDPRPCSGCGSTSITSGDWSMVQDRSREPLRAGDRIPDAELHGPDGRPVRLHDLDRRQLRRALFHRRAPPARTSRRTSRACGTIVVSRRDAPLDGGLRDAFAVRRRRPVPSAPGCPSDTLVLVRPDDHIAAMTCDASSERRTIVPTGGRASRPMQHRIGDRSWPRKPQPRANWDRSATRSCSRTNSCGCGV